MSHPAPSDAWRTRPWIVLMAFVAVLVMVSALVVALGRSEDDDASNRASTAGTGSGTAERGTTATSPPEPIMFGDQTYVSPCRVLPIDDVERIFGSLGAYGNVNQEFHDESLSKNEFRAETDTVTNSVRTACNYRFDDRASSSLRVEVSQYRDDRLSRARWASIAYLGTGKESEKLARETFGDGFGFVVKLARENERDSGGQPVAGARRSLLYVAGEQSFISFADNVLIRITLPDADSSFVDQPLAADEYARQAPRMKKAVAVIRRQLAADDLEQTPLPTVIGEETGMGDVPYLEPCDLLDVEAFEVATNRAPDAGVQSDSLVKDTAERRARNEDLYFRSSVNTCERRASWRPNGSVTSKSSNARLEVRYAPSEEQSLELLQSHLVAKFVPDEQQGPDVHPG